MKNPVSGMTKRILRRVGSAGEMFQSKYIEIILAVGLFILLDTGVLIVNFYTSYQIANDAHAIQLASRMGTLSQRLFHELYQIEEDALDSDADYYLTIDILADTYKTFDETFDAFIYGGELIGAGQGKDALLQDDVYRNTSANLLTDAEDIWKEYRVLLKPVVYAYFNEAGRDEVLAATGKALDFARHHNEKLLNLMVSFSSAVEGVAKRKAERLRMIQSIGITLAVINFFLILFHFLHRLRKSDALAEKSQKETEDILENVNEGLLLLDRDFTIGMQHSKSLHTLFKQDELAGQNFIELLGKIVSEKDLESVKEYGELLFSPRVNESLVSDLNPLDRVGVNLEMDGAVFETRYFGFQFSRVEDKNGFNSLLVTVKDITRQVQLADQLKEAGEKSGREIDMLLTIIHLDNRMLVDYLQATGDGLNEVNLILKSPLKEKEKMKDKLEPISRIVHKLKGDSSSLGLDFFVQKFHFFEQEVSRLKESPMLQGEDFLPLVVALKQLISDFFVIENLKEKKKIIDLADIHLHKSVPSEERADEKSEQLDFWNERMTTLVDNVAGDLEKKITLDISEFDAGLLPESLTEPVMAIIVQSLRNGVVHGIEAPDMREKMGKSVDGCVKVRLERNGAELCLTVRDDGQGLDLEKIKKTALLKGLVNNRQLQNMNRAKVLGLMFKQGFTTVHESGIHAGQGVGLDLIRSQVKKLNGKISLKYQPGLYTEFQYIFILEPEVLAA